MSSLFHVRLVNGATGDPGLYCEMAGQRRGLLFDLGDVTALMPRELLRVSHAFVSRTHMGCAAWTGCISSACSWTRTAATRNASTT